MQQTGSMPIGSQLVQLAVLTTYSWNIVWGRGAVALRDSRLRESELVTCLFMSRERRVRLPV